MQLSSDAAAALQKINQLYVSLDKRRKDNAKLERYFRGEQPLAYASDEWRHVHQGRYKDFADNWCGVVGSAPGERTEINGIRLGSDTDVQSEDEKRLWTDWEVNDGPAQSSQGFLTTTIAKRSAVLVWGDENDEPVMTWEHPSQVIVERDPTTRARRFALKVWAEDDREFATLYTPSLVWKFQRSRVAVAVAGDGRTESGLYVASSGLNWAATGGWEPRENGGGDTWPLPNPMGIVPVVEFPNRPMLGGEPLSDIAGTTAMQDAINMLWAYLFVAADYASMPARVVLGQEPPKVPILDSNGQKIGEKPVDNEQLTRGRMLWLTGQNTKVDQWEAARLDVFTDVIQVAAKHIAAQTRTPIYLIHGELGNVNGDTLTGLDAPLNSKVRETHKFSTTPVREVFSMFALVRGDKDLAGACRSAVIGWANPEVRSDAQVSDAAVKDAQIGWPFAAILEKRYGLSQPEIARIIAMRRDEDLDPLTDRLLRPVTGQSVDDAQLG